MCFLKTLAFSEVALKVFFFLFIDNLCNSAKKKKSVEKYCEGITNDVICEPAVVKNYFNRLLYICVWYSVYNWSLVL